MKSIVIADSQTELVAELASRLKFLPSTEVIAFDDGAKAHEWLSNHNCVILITSLCLGHVDGIQLISLALNRNVSMPVLVISDDGLLQDLAETMAPWRNVEFFKKPLDLDIFCRRVLELFQAIPDSTLHHVAPLEFLQWVSMQGKDCLVRITQLGKQGYLYFEAGKPHYAAFANAVGDEALRLILAQGSAELQIFEGHRKMEQNVLVSLNRLLLEYCSALDEKSAPPSGSLGRP